VTDGESDVDGENTDEEWTEVSEKIQVIILHFFVFDNYFYCRI